MSLTYLYDTRKVDFRHIAGELVLPANLLISASLQPKEGDADKIEAAVEGDGEGQVVGKQFRRTPFAAIFQAAWFNSRSAPSTSTTATKAGSL